MTPLIVAVILIGTLIILYVAAYILNRRVAKPEGIKDGEANCGRCPLNRCPLRKKDEEN